MSDPTTGGGEDARVRPAPPTGRRFQRGQSGNPKGGPKRPATLTADVEWLFSLTPAEIEDGTLDERRLPLARALLLQTARKALKDDDKARAELFRLREKAEATREAQAAAKAKKAAEARARREAQEDEEANRPPRPPIFYPCSSPDEALQEMGVWRTLSCGRKQITRAAFNALTAMDPGVLERMDPYVRDTMHTYLEPEPEPVPAESG